MIRLVESSCSDLSGDISRRTSRRALTGCFEEVAGISSNLSNDGSAYPSVCNQLGSKIVSPPSEVNPVGIVHGSFVDMLRQQSKVSNFSVVCGEGECNKSLHQLMALVDKERQLPPGPSKSSKPQPGTFRQEVTPGICLSEKSSWEVGETSGHKRFHVTLTDYEPIGFNLGIEDDDILDQDCSGINKDGAGSSHDVAGIGSLADDFVQPASVPLINEDEPVIEIAPSACGTLCRPASDPEPVEDDNLHQDSSGTRQDCPVISDDVELISTFDDDFVLPSSVPTITVDDPLFADPPPECDNLRGPAPEERNMDLKMGLDAIYVGRIFASKKDLHSTLCVYALKRLFNFRCNKSDKTRMIANCVDPKCIWRIYAVAHEGSENFEIRTAEMRHSCDVAARSRYGEKATAKVLAGLLQHKFSNGKKGPRACDLPTMVLSELKVNISYMKAWHAKEVAIATARGNDEESYNFLSTYLHLVRTTNPGTITEMVTQQDKNGNYQFKFLFFAMGASIAGFQYLRKVVVIDGTQMKGKYKGCLVAASGQDGDMRIFPLAFGVVDSENEASWVWFFQNLKKFIPDSNDLLFVSDRHPSIYSGIRAAYPLAHHGACAVHLCRNIRSRFKSEGLVDVVSKAARAYTVGDFRFWWAEIEKRSPACDKYLLNIGLPHWTLSHCTGMRFNVMSSNISESLNSAMLRAVHYPIVSMLEFLRAMLMRWFSERRLTAKNSKYHCTPEIEALLNENLEEATACAVLSASEWVYQVNDASGCVFTVDLLNKTCTCRVFDVLLVPCCHALAARGAADINLFSLVGDCYGTNTWYKVYEHVVMPIPRVIDVDIPADVTAVSVNPPTTRRGSGRPKKVRIPSCGEGKYVVKKRAAKCGRCFGTGHNRSTCKSPI